MLLALVLAVITPQQEAAFKADAAFVYDVGRCELYISDNDLDRLKSNWDKLPDWYSELIYQAFNTGVQDALEYARKHGYQVSPKTCQRWLNEHK